jgi:hypothetical protein
MPLPLIAAALMPLANKLFSNGLNILGNALLNKGKEAIEEKLGVDIEELTNSDEGLLKLKQAELDHEEFLITAAIENRKLDMEELKVGVDNTTSAREMNTALQTSAEAMAFVKVLPYILDAAIVGGTLLIGLILFWVKIPIENKELAYTMFGGLLAHCSTILNFHRGSSSSNRGKDTVIAHLTTGSKQ